MKKLSTFQFEFVRRLQTKIQLPLHLVAVALLPSLQPLVLELPTIPQEPQQLDADQSHHPTHLLTEKVLHPRVRSPALPIRLQRLALLVLPLVPRLPAQVQQVAPRHHFQICYPSLIHSNFLQRLALEPHCPRHHRQNLKLHPRHCLQCQLELLVQVQHPMQLLELVLAVVLPIHYLVQLVLAEEVLPRLRPELVLAAALPIHSLVLAAVLLELVLPIHFLVLAVELLELVLPIRSLVLVLAVVLPIRFLEQVAVVAQLVRPIHYLVLELALPIHCLCQSPECPIQQPLAVVLEFPGSMRPIRHQLAALAVRPNHCLLAPRKVIPIRYLYQWQECPNRRLLVVVAQLVRPIRCLLPRTVYPIHLQPELAMDYPNHCH